MANQPGRPKKEAANPDLSKDPRTTPHKEPGPLKDEPTTQEPPAPAQPEPIPDQRPGADDPLSDLPEPNTEPAEANEVEVVSTPTSFTYDNAPTGYGPNSRLTPPSERR